MCLLPVVPYVTHRDRFQKSDGATVLLSEQEDGGEKDEFADQLQKSCCIHCRRWLDLQTTEMPTKGLLVKPHRTTHLSLRFSLIESLPTTAVLRCAHRRRQGPSRPAATRWPGDERLRSSQSQKTAPG